MCVNPNNVGAELLIPESELKKSPGNNHLSFFRKMKNHAM